MQCKLNGEINAIREEMLVLQELLQTTVVSLNSRMQEIDEKQESMETNIDNLREQ